MRANLSCLSGLVPWAVPLISCAVLGCGSQEAEDTARATGIAMPASLGTAFAGSRELVAPAAPGSVTPHLSLGRNGEVYASWQEPTASGHAVRMSVLRDSSWSEPLTITVGEDFFVNWADFPSVVELPDGSLAAHWLQREGPGTYAYGVRISRSSDGGISWSAPITPHLDGTETEHGFVSLFPGDAGRLAAVWLDGRAFAQAAAEGEPPDADMSVRYAEIAASGEIVSEALLDERACDCCQTSAAVTSEGAILVYRDRSEAEIRDISIVRRLESGWTEPVTVHSDGWRIPACPVNGPAAAARDRDVVVAWYTAADEEPRVQVAFSPDAGATFGDPIRVDRGNALGRVDAVMLPDRSAIVIWLATSAEGAVVLARRVRPDGALSDVEAVGTTDGSRSSGFPRMVLRSDDLVMAWTDTAGDGAIRTAVVALHTN